MLAINSDLLSAPREAAGSQCLFSGVTSEVAQNDFFYCVQKFSLETLFFESCQNFLQALGCSQLKSRTGFFYFFALASDNKEQKESSRGEKPRSNSNFNKPRAGFLAVRRHQGLVPELQLQTHLEVLPGSRGKAGKAPCEARLGRSEPKAERAELQPGAVSWQDFPALIT